MEQSHQPRDVEPRRAWDEDEYSRGGYSDPPTNRILDREWIGGVPDPGQASATGRGSSSADSSSTSGFAVGRACAGRGPGICDLDYAEQSGWAGGGNGGRRDHQGTFGEPGDGHTKHGPGTDASSQRDQGVGGDTDEKPVRACAGERLFHPGQTAQGAGGVREE